MLQVTESGTRLVAVLGIAVGLSMSACTSKTRDSARSNDNDHGAKVADAGRSTGTDAKAKDSPDSYYELDGFYTRFRKAVAHDEREYVARCLRYPMRVLSNGRSLLTVHGPQELLMHYEQVFTGELRGRIARSEGLEPSIGPAVTADGSIRVYHTCADDPEQLCSAGPIRVVAINIPGK